MKKSIILAVMLPFVLSSCISIGNKKIKDLETKVEQLQKDVAELQQANRTNPQQQCDMDSTKVIFNTNTLKQEKSEVLESANSINVDKQQAIKAIKYCLKMYQPSLKYTAIRATKKPNKTVDVIIDYYWHGSTEHTYYNVSLYENGEFKINDINGLEGEFPHDDKFSME
ncbi:MAG: hypothetical protein MJZ76_07765 [Bacteroidales bacterium]|nr:hypothetical protein [Bacteroidales bacterium]